jgi:hypothetical protein
LQSAGTTAVTINTSQQVGIGTTSPASPLQINTAGVNTTVQINSTDASGGYGANLSFNNTGAGGRQYVIYSTSNADGDVGGGKLKFTDATASATRMFIDSSGNLRIGQTSGNADARTSINGGSTDSSPCIDYVKNSSTTSTAQVYARFTANATGTGSITANGAAAAAFTAWSDKRLKENITDLPSQLANIMALRPVEFDYVESMGGGHQIGFIAQDVQAIYPDLVGESSDGMLTLTDMNKNDARLIKAIQELKAINDTQAATITALTARIEALENK